LTRNRILVTGAAGFIGAKVCELLLQSGAEIDGVDNLNDYYSPKLKEYRIQRLKNFDNFRFYKLDIENFEILENIFSQNKFSAVINLAARAGVRASIDNPFVYATTNFIGTLNLLELSAKYNVPKFVLASSSSVYAGEQVPFTENMQVDKPISPYAATKKSAELIAYAYHHLYGIDVSVLRFFTVYGAAGRPDMSYFQFIEKIKKEQEIVIYGDGTQKRDFTYIQDIAEGVVAAIKDVGYEIINLGGGKTPIEINFMIKLIEQKLGKKAKIVYKDFHNADMNETGADISKAKLLLDWKPKVDFENGLEQTIRWHIDNNEFLKTIQ
jgi:nucleoside-diphosphate-sugar epimerase